MADAQQSQSANPNPSNTSGQATPPVIAVVTKPDHFSFITKFILFVRQQGVIGLAVAVVLGGAVQKVVTALVTDILTPIISIVIGQNTNLATASFHVGGAVFLYGDFISNLIDFFIIAFAIYLLVKIIHADMLDKPKE